ncbi:MAG: DNA-binding protein [Thermoguttaceae bacterium]|jgi:hypothetical protein
MKVTPPKLAKSWGIDAHKILTWIETGELAAINAATKPGGRPRFLIDEKDIELFELRRSTTPAPKSIRRRRAKDMEVIEYF